MAGDDYSIKTKVEADVSNFEKGMNKAEKSLKGFSSKLADNINRLGKNGLVGSIANVSLALGGLTQAFNIVVKAAKKVGQAINECTEAYKLQEIAERALDVAIQNNPFISGASSNALKEFASEMQKVSNYGDEELIPMMTNLVSLGRTESETMKIMSVAMDMSAGMGISLDSAINQLNATLNGNIGRLGQQNAELKGLTEEELKQGKAIEILGQKFKGLSSATADTSKQLKNIKGDFKEALGQFTLPSSDMWNRFWAGFYEKGTKVLNRLAADIKASDLLLDLEKYVATSKKGMGEAITSYLAGLRDEELTAINDFLEKQKKLTEEQKQLYSSIQEEIRSREYLAELRRKEAEDAEKARLLEEERKRRAEEQAERERLLAEERKRLADEQAKREEYLANLRKSWQDKLLNQRIDMLETERDKAMQIAEEEGRDAYYIWLTYNKDILRLKLERLEKEKEEALAVEGQTEEDKNAITTYYGEEEKKIYDELGNYKKKKKKEEIKDERSKIEILMELVKLYAQRVKQVFATIAENIKRVFSKVVSVVKDVISSSVNVFKKMFEFNTDDALDAILVVEDKILTFFVETLPKMPNFLKSVIQSVKSLLKSLKKVIKKEDISKALYSMLETIGDNLPDMIKDLLGILKDLINGAVAGLISWLDSGGFATILNLILEIQKTVESIVSDNIGTIADTLADHVQDIADFLAKSMTSANKTLPKLLKAVISIVVTLIDAIAKAFENDEFVQSIIDSIIEVTGAIINAIPKFIGAIVNLLASIIAALIPHLPELIIKLIEEIVGAIPSVLSDIVKELGNAFLTIFKKIFTKDFWLGILNPLGSAMGDTLASTLAGSSMGSISTGNAATNAVSAAGLKLWANGSNSVPKGLSIVGEAGPELVNFGGGEQVLNNRNTNKALASMGGNTNNFNVTFNNLQDTTAFTMMQQLKAYNRQMAINAVF